MRACSIVIALCVIFVHSICAAQDQYVSNFEQRLSALENKPLAPLSFNPSARAEVKDGCDLFLTADLLYFTPRENGLEFAVKGNPLSAPDTSAKLKDLNFDWELGVRVGLGYNIPHDQWDIYLNWLRFYPNAHGEAKGHDLSSVWTNPILIPPNPNPAIANSADGHWNMRLDQLDLELGREFFVSRWLSLRPHLGLRNAWIRQHYTLEYSFIPDIYTLPPMEDRVSLKNRFWGLGMCAGLDTQWTIKGGWSLYGNAAFALLYSEFHLHNDEHSVFSSFTLDLKAQNHQRLVTGIFDLAAGLAWDHMFADDSFHFGFKLGWEQHIYFAQNQLFRTLNPDNPAIIIANQGDLTLQGWTLSARVDF